MKENLNREQHISPADTRSSRRPKKPCRWTATLAELAGISTPDELSQSTAPAIDERQEVIFSAAPVYVETVLSLEELSEAPTLAEARRGSNNGEVTNAAPDEVALEGSSPQRPDTVNDLFANLVYGDRVKECSLQEEVLSKFRPIIRSAAHKTGYLRFLKNHRALCDGDWESTGNFCLTKEVVRFRTVSLYEIDRIWKANKFAYIWKALREDFKDEMRKIRRRPEVFLGDTPDDDCEIRDPNPQTEPGCSGSCLLDSQGEQFQRAARSLPAGPAAIAEAIAELCRNPKQLLELTAPELSDRASKTLLVEHLAKSRGVRTQVVRKNIRQFKEHSDDPEYACVRELLRQNIVPVWRPPTITAPTAVALQLSPVLVAALSVSADVDTASKAWEPKCVICDTRLHNEGDFCSVCVPEDEERKFRGFSRGSKSHDVASHEIDLVGKDEFGAAL